MKIVKIDEFNRLELVYLSNVFNNLYDYNLGKYKYTYAGTRYNQSYRRNFYNSVVRNPKSMIIGDKTAIDSMFKTVQSVKNQSVTIVKSDKIMFLKESAYPRHKFSNSCENSKVIKPAKADCIVIPDNYAHSYITNKDNKVVRLYDDTVSRYLIMEKELIKELKNHFGKDEEGSISSFLRDAFFNTSYKYEILQDSVMICDNSDETITVFNDYPAKLITEKHIDDYLNGKLPVMDEESYKTINSFLGSPDAATIDLGIRTLNNYDILGSSMYISLLVRNNYAKLNQANSFTSVGFKNIVKVLNLGNCNYDSNIEFMTKMYKNLSKPEEQKFVRETVREEILKAVTEDYRFSNAIKYLDLDVKVL